MISKDIAKKEYPVSIKEDENFPGSANIFLIKNDRLINIGSFYKSSDNKETVILNLYGKASYGDYLERSRHYPINRVYLSSREIKKNRKENLPFIYYNI